MKKTVSGIMLTLFLLISTLTLTFNIRSVKAQESIYINPDGSIIPSNANITTSDLITYTFTDNNYLPIVVNRSNIIINGMGYTLRASEVTGFSLTSVSNVTIKNTTIICNDGIDLISSSGDVISGNNMTENLLDISLYDSDNNSISGNNIGNILLDSSSYNSISGNNVRYVSLFSSSYNNISGNNNIVDLELDTSSYNSMTNNILNYSSASIFMAIIVTLSDNNNVSENNITELTEFCFYVAGSSYNSISGNNIANSNHGICLVAFSHNNSISGNNITDSGFGIVLDHSANNDVSGNNMPANFASGIVVYYSSYNSISGNNITANSYNGITVDHSSYNGISENNMADNHYGIGLYSSSNNNMIANNIADNLYCGLLLSNASNNIVYHNSFIGNYVQASADSLSIGNAWNDTYPWGGNYWSDYTGVDEKRGPNQDQLGSDGIGDSPYVIGPPTEQDHYPLMKPYGGPSDIGITSITRSKTAVGQGFSLDLSVKAVNYGIFSEAFSITVYANTTIITTFTNIILASRNSTTITFTWNTAGFVKGNYTISAIATPVLGETDLSDNTCTGGSVQITEVGDLGSRVGGTNVFFAFDGAVTSTDLQLFRECFKGTAPSEYVYLADLGSRVNGVNTFFVCDGLVTSADLQLFRQCYNGQGPPDP